MEHTYVLVREHKAYIVALVSDENSSGRYRMYDFSRNYMRREVYEDREEFENKLDNLCERKIIEGWAKITFEK